MKNKIGGQEKNIRTKAFIQKKKDRNRKLTTTYHKQCVC
jgi:hypothetical protein